MKKIISRTKPNPLADTVKELRTELAQANSDYGRLERFVWRYSSPGPNCKSCGEITYPGYICAACGHDGE